MSHAMLSVIGLLVVSMATAKTPPAKTTAAKMPSNGPTASAVLSDLKAGNERHASHHHKNPHQSAERMHELTNGQHPEAVVLTCADSRVPPEIVFDQGLGDLFDIRVAGNIAADAEIASIEYAAEHLHTPLVVVMGHQSCGAVAAAIEGGNPPGHLPTLVAAIRPAVNQARGMPGELADNAVRVNVEHVVQQLRSSKPVLATLVSEKKLRIVGAVYSLKTGLVTWLPE
jgi:carbonic anhydrase